MSKINQLTPDTPTRTRFRRIARALLSPAVGLALACAVSAPAAYAVSDRDFQALEQKVAKLEALTAKLASRLASAAKAGSAQGAQIEKLEAKLAVLQKGGSGGADAETKARIAALNSDVRQTSQSLNAKIAGVREESIQSNGQIKAQVQSMHSNVQTLSSGANEREAQIRQLSTSLQSTNQSLVAQVNQLKAQANNNANEIKQLKARR